MEDFTLLWQQVCLDLKEDLSDFSFHTWVEPLHAVALENNRLILVAPASNIRENLMHRCYEMIVHKVREKTNHSDFQVDILLESEWGQPQTPSFHPIEQKRHALNPAIPLTPLWWVRATNLRMRRLWGLPLRPAKNTIRCLSMGAPALAKRI